MLWRSSPSCEARELPTLEAISSESLVISPCMTGKDQTATFGSVELRCALRWAARRSESEHFALVESLATGDAIQHLQDAHRFNSSSCRCSSDHLPRRWTADSLCRKESLLSTTDRSEFWLPECLDRFSRGDTTAYEPSFSSGKNKYYHGTLHRQTSGHSAPSDERTVACLLALPIDPSRRLVGSLSGILVLFPIRTGTYTDSLWR